MATSTAVISILLLYALISLAEATGFNCKGISKDKDRKEVLTILNEYRYNLTTENPTYVHAYTNQTYHLPRAKNMYELEWDCDMEAKAEISMNMSCKHAARKAFPEYGHTLGTWEQCIKFGKPVEQYGIRGVLDGWWDQGYGMSDKTKYDDFRIQDFAHIANGRNTKVGCAITKRGQRADVYCLYDLFVPTLIGLAFQTTLTHWLT
ncbi:SCP-like protein [Ancylostoma ceylanicum]|uniref:SCP-like protein n=1 Tax=Ancylostoma ceylanicum TaxID=53326 RepID=A0A0D6M7Z3_9BILA|nr:SCP-like protein [Ancylostoma ceylanicum]